MTAQSSATQGIVVSVGGLLQIDTSAASGNAAAGIRVDDATAVFNGVVSAGGDCADCCGVGRRAEYAEESGRWRVPNLANEIAALQAQVAALQPNPKLLFAEHDRVVALDPGTGVGALSGVVAGRVTGTSTLNFALALTSPFNYTFNGRTGITDVDGDQGGVSSLALLVRRAQPRP